MVPYCIRRVQSPQNLLSQFLPPAPLQQRASVSRKSPKKKNAQGSTALATWTDIVLCGLSVKRNKLLTFARFAIPDKNSESYNGIPFLFSMLCGAEIARIRPITNFVLEKEGREGEM